jgi:hypothetical protein
MREGSDIIGSGVRNCLEFGKHSPRFVIVCEHDYKYYQQSYINERRLSGV